jgi:hypothetical protein
MIKSTPVVRPSRAVTGHTRRALKGAAMMRSLPLAGRANSGGLGNQYAPEAVAHLAEARIVGRRVLLVPIAAGRAAPLAVFRRIVGVWGRGFHGPHPTTSHNSIEVSR